MKIFAFVVDNEVVNVLHFEDWHPYKERYVSGLSSSPFFINISNYQNINIGDYYINNNFYLENDLENPIQETSVFLNPEDFFISSFAAISDNKIFGIIKISSAAPEHDLIVAGMSSNPNCIDASEYNDVEIGWTWNGETFSPPQGE